VLDADDAAYIARRTGEPLRGLAPMLGVSHETVGKVRRALPDEGEPEVLPYRTKLYNLE